MEGEPLADEATEPPGVGGRGEPADDRATFRVPHHIAPAVKRFRDPVGMTDVYRTIGAFSRLCSRTRGGAGSSAAIAFAASVALPSAVAVTPGVAVAVTPGIAASVSTATSVSLAAAVSITVPSTIATRGKGRSAYQQSNRSEDGRSADRRQKIAL